MDFDELSRELAQRNPGQAIYPQRVAAEARRRDARVQQPPALVRVPARVYEALTGPELPAEVRRVLRERLVPETASEQARSPAVVLVLRERHRQLERWSAGHDDRYAPSPPAVPLGELVEMALWWADEDKSVIDWPFLGDCTPEADGEPPERERHSRVEQLVRAAALLCAEVDRRLRDGETPSLAAAALAAGEVDAAVTAPDPAWWLSYTAEGEHGYPVTVRCAWWRRWWRRRWDWGPGGRWEPTHSAHPAGGSAWTLGGAQRAVDRAGPKGVRR